MMERYSADIPLPRIGAEPPSELRLFHWGLNQTKKGPVFLTKKSAAKIMAEYEQDGHALVFDKEHSMFNPKAAPEDMAAYGYFRLSLKEDGLWATDIQWTEEGKKDVQSGKWAFFSPAILKNPFSNLITKMLNAALTNLPATKGIRPLLLSATFSGSPNMDESLRTKVQPLKQIMSAGSMLLGACQMAMDGGSDIPMKDLAQKITSILPDWIEAAAEMMEQLDPEGKTMPEENEEMKMSQADTLQGETVVQEASVAAAAVESAPAPGAEVDEMGQLYALCKELTGKEALDEIRGVLRAMKHNQKVVEEQLSVAEKRSITATVEKAVLQGLIRPAEKQEYMSLSAKELDAYLLSARPVVDFGRVDQGFEQVSGLSQKNAPVPAEYQEAMQRIFEKAVKK